MEIRKCLAHVDWNDKIKHNKATESWNILKSELVSVINRYIHLNKNEGNGPR